MGERQVFQPLTREDRVTVVIYRVGIVLSAVMMCGLAFLLTAATSGNITIRPGTLTDVLFYGLYVSVGLSVFFMHLYVSAFHRYLKYLYGTGIACLIVLLVIGKGSLSGALVQYPAGAMLLLPVSGCLGFVTAKEAFCFQLFEGYLLAMVMPLYLLLVATGSLAGRGASFGLALIAVMLVVFTLRKVFQPLAWDIGDKSAYR